jgi:hypothetical protein
VLGIWPLENKRFTGIRSNRWASLSVLIDSGKLYPVLHDPIVVSDGFPNAHPEVTSKHNLEPFLITKCSIFPQVFGNNLEFLEVPGCSFVGKIF